MDRVDNKTGKKCFQSKNMTNCERNWCFLGHNSLIVSVLWWYFAFWSQNKGCRMVFEKLWVSANSQIRVSESRAPKAEHGISNFAIWVLEAKRKNRHKKSYNQTWLGKIVTIDYNSYRGSGGMLPRKILKFWALRYAISCILSHFQATFIVI